MAMSTQTKKQTQLTLTHLKGTYAVVRLDPNSKPPEWFWESRFYSITKTDDELSIVCEQSNVPTEISNNDKLCETGWGLFKVEGPLDFGLTGILNKLTTPLAKAGISIFAISTYDTDYILVKEKCVSDAGYAWKLAGHAVQGMPESRPKDGSAVTFEKDPILQTLIDLEQGKESVEETYGLIVVAGWEPSEGVQDAYRNDFLPAVQKCFLESDWKSSSAEGEIPNVYLYPSRHLHVTVATLHAFHRPHPSKAMQEILTKEWTELVRAASKREGWPNKPFQLSLVSAQIGKRAGILLWKDLTDGMDQMRICIKAETEARERQLIQAGIDPDTLSIPGIIHTSFVRFHETPATPGEEVQKKFQEHVVGNLHSFFEKPVTIDCAKLVCERKPYMHIDPDERHVFETFSLNSS